MQNLHHTCYHWSGAAHVKCNTCALPITYWCGTRFIVHESGWWEPYTGVCHCRFFDRLGFPLDDRSPIVTTCREFHSTPVDLAIDYVVNMEYVKYYSYSDPSVSDDTGPHITLGDIVSVKAFFKLRALSRNFRYSTLPALRELRSRSNLIAFLPLVMFHRCRCCCTSLRKWGIEMTAGLSDFALIQLLGIGMRSLVQRSYGRIPSRDADKYGIRIYSSEDHGDTSGSTSGSKQQFDWQLFSHGGRLWVWRCSTQECFFVDEPPVGWARYFCSAGKFYWWHNDLSEAWFLENSSSHPNQTSY